MKQQSRDRKPGWCPVHGNVMLKQCGTCKQYRCERCKFYTRSDFTRKTKSDCKECYNQKRRIRRAERGIPND